ncbi:MAG: right-handed parallel beta-helix repeat-containing protein [Nostoc sp.]|uniref:right-handed parallel beta-helix repeat-containing protein n=1 Tax=Nostoc sp. TaxID=1180 RepID=UPI002FFA422C
MTIQFLQHTLFFPMMIHGFGFLSLSASLVLPWALTGLVQGQRITESLVRDIPQLSPVHEKQLPSRKLISQAAPTTYYVSGDNGDDNKSGLNEANAFKRIQRAADLTNPGDTVLIMNGLYTNLPGAGSAVSINRSGTANAWITYKAYPGHTPRIKHNTWNGFELSGVSYIEINGIEISGDNDNTSYSYALSQQYNTSNPRTNGNCITLNGTNNPVHHINIVNNKVFNCGGGGIIALSADYVKVSNNSVFNNAWYGVYGGSGISFLKNRNTDDNQGYKIFITNNKVFNNQNFIPWYEFGKVSDGNGIIVDQAKDGPSGSYKGRTLIANNISYKNGGAGIVVHASEHVDVVNNTAYANGNSQEIAQQGQVYAGFSSDVKIFNNIISAYPGQYANNNYENVNVVYDYNLYPNGALLRVTGTHDIIADPGFVDPSNDDFRLTITSRATNHGYYWGDLKTDYAGDPRPIANAYDMGAYEYQYK